jgi:uncharacterized membrane protein
MMMPRRAPSRWTDESVEQLLGNLLRVGVIVATAIGAIGALLYLSRYGGQAAAFREFRGEPAALRTLHGIARGALALEPAAIIQLGLVCLIATPVVRVAMSLVAFILQRDRLYVIITAIVLALLGYGLLHG